MSLFARIDAVAAQTMAAVHADAYQHAPMKAAADVKASAVVDPSRPAMTILGIYREKEASARVPNSYDRRTDQRPGVEATVPQIEVDPRVQAAGFVDVRPRDLLTGPDGHVWRVSKVHPDEMGRLFCAVNLADA